jgi:uncharacterized membrane protein YhaH (DUF805 family)
MSESDMKRLLETLLTNGAWFGLHTILFVLALVLPRLRARGWLIAGTATLLAANIWDIVVRSVLSLSFDTWTLLWPLPATANTIGMACLILFVYAQRTAANDHVTAGDIMFSFRGRIARRHFWLGSLVISVPGWLPLGAMLSPSKDTQKGALAAYVLWALLMLLPSFAIHVKRWHDRGKSGWMLLVNFIPIVGPIWAFIETGCLPGTPGPNQYGDDPLAVVSPQRQAPVPFQPAPSPVAEQPWRPLDFK